MMKIFGAIVFILPLLASANIWDNLFDGQGVPFELPMNFTAQATPADLSQKVKYNLVSSVVFNALAIDMNYQTETSEGALKSLLTKFRFNFNLGFLWIHSEPKGCVRIYDPDFIFDFYYRFEGLLELALLLTSRDLVDEYKKVAFDPQVLDLEISNCVQDVALYFLNDQTLSKIEAEFKNGTKGSFNVDYISHKSEVSYPEVSPQSDWTCKELNEVTIDDVKYLVDTDGKRQTFSDVLSEFIKDTSKAIVKKEDREEYVDSFERFRQSFIRC